MTAERKPETQIKTFYATFGTQYVADAELRERTGFGQQHPTFPLADRDGYVEIRAYDMHQARQFADAAFPDPRSLVWEPDKGGWPDYAPLYGFLYTENPHRAPSFYYPKGALAVIGVTVPARDMLAGRRTET